MSAGWPGSVCVQLSCATSQDWPSNSARAPAAPPTTRALPVTERRGSATGEPYGGSATRNREQLRELLRPEDHLRAAEERDRLARRLVADGGVPNLGCAAAVGEGRPGN